jgi:HSP20 family protein
MARTDAEYTILVDVPGVPKETLEVDAVGDELTISGDRPQPDLPEGAEVLRAERGFGRFSRTVRLPTEVDVTAVRAKLDSGVLRVTLPRRGGEGKKKIDIEV